MVNEQAVALVVLRLYVVQSRLKEVASDLDAMDAARVGVDVMHHCPIDRALAMRRMNDEAVAWCEALVGDSDPLDDEVPGIELRIADELQYVAPIVDGRTDLQSVSKDVAGIVRYQNGHRA